MRVVMAVLALSVASPTSAGDEPFDRAQVLASAQQHFAAGVAEVRTPAEARRHFAAAANDFAVVARAAPNPALYLALGNAEALAGRWPQAIWAYQCGRQLDPNDAALRTQLDHARSLVPELPNGRGRPRPDAWPAWLHRPSAGAWLLLATIAYSLACLTAAYAYQRRQGWSLAVGLVAVALSAAAGYAVETQIAQYNATHPLVIIAADATPLQRGNGPSYPLHPDVPTLPAGLEARLIHQRGTWLQIELTTGEIGWLPQSAALVCTMKHEP